MFQSGICPEEGAESVEKETQVGTCQQCPGKGGTQRLFFSSVIFTEMPLDCV